MGSTDNDLTGLMHASWRGDGDRVRALLDRGEPVDARGPEGLTALMFAAKEHHAAVCRLLVEHGADASTRATDASSCFHGETPLLLAAGFPGSEGLLETVTVLLDAGADPNDHREGDTALHYCAAKAEVETVRLLLARGAEVEGVPDRGETPLIAAVRHVGFPGEPARRLATVRELVAAGADPRRRGELGDSALSLARSQGDAALLRELLAAP